MKNMTKNILIFLIIGIIFILIDSEQDEYSNETDKINFILNQIDDNYVDSIEMSSLVESSIEQILKNLDPHSYYLMHRLQHIDG